MPIKPSLPRDCRVREHGGMRTIGLVGGMSWYSTLEYYRVINAEVQRRRGGHASAAVALANLDIFEREDLCGHVLEKEPEFRGMLDKLKEDLPIFPEAPPPGLVTVPAVADAPAGYYPRAGYRLAGDRAIRIDMLERLADMVRNLDARSGFDLAKLRCNEQ